MSRGTFRRVRGVIAKSAVAVTFMGMIAAVPANAVPVPLDPDPGIPTGPDDTRCAAMSYLAQCQGGPFAVHSPTGPADLACVTMPADPVCAGGPYALPTPPAVPPADIPSPPPAAPPADIPTPAPVPPPAAIPEPAPMPAPVSVPEPAPMPAPAPMPDPEAGAREPGHI